MPQWSLPTSILTVLNFALLAYEMSLENFLDWSPILANVTPCALQPGYRYCLASV